MGGERDDAPAQLAALEAELRDERAQFALAERAACIGYWRLSLRDNHYAWSPGMYRIFGIDRSEKAPDPERVIEKIEPEDVRVINERISTAIRTRSPFYYRSRARDAGPVQIVDTHGEVELGPDGRVVAVVGVCQDVTRQVEAETKRAKAEERYRLMMEEASDIIMLHTADGRVEFASAALERLLGRTIREFDDKGYLHMVHPDDRAEAEKLAIRPKPGETRTATYRVRHAAGHYVWIEATTRSVHDEATGEFLHVVGVSRDVTARREQEIAMEIAREAAETANRAKSAFLANDESTNCARRSMPSWDLPT